MTIHSAGLAVRGLRRPLYRGFELYAPQKLRLVAVHADYVSNETSFSEFVADAEALISSEHTLWFARRDTLKRARVLSNIRLRPGRSERPVDRA